MTASGGHDQRPLGLLTDLYELRMAQTCLQTGMTAAATFSLYIRPSPERAWYLAAGTEAALDLMEQFRYGKQELDYLRELGFAEGLLDWLADLYPSGEVWAPADGTVMLADEPLLEVTAPLPEAMLLETALLSVVQLPTVIATKAARCTLVADGRPFVDFGLRRAHGLEAGVTAARAAYLGGCASTSNVEAGRRFGLPVAGTMAHSFVQAHGDELAAFRAFVADHPDNSILLVDTYDTIQGVRHAIQVADEMRARGQQLTGVRLDSGDLADLARRSRRMLDDAGHTDARIFASGGIDEWKIHELVSSDVPIDAFGVGTSLTVSRDHPATDIVYKLVSYDGNPRAKYSLGKAVLPGPKQVFRPASPQDDVLARRDEQLDGEPLLQPVWRDGQRVTRFDLEEARQRAAEQLERLPASWRHPDGPDEAPRPRLSDGVEQLANETRAAELGT